MKRSITAMLSTALSFVAVVAYGSEGFDCGGHIISAGDSKAEVEEHCGPPSSNEGSTWIYERGSEQFTVTVHFEADGTVNRIEKE